MDLWNWQKWLIMSPVGVISSCVKWWCHLKWFQFSVTSIDRTVCDQRVISDSKATKLIQLHVHIYMYMSCRFNFQWIFVIALCYQVVMLKAGQMIKVLKCNPVTRGRIQIYLCPLSISNDSYILMSLWSYFPVIFTIQDVCSYSLRIHVLACPASG